MPHIVLDFVGLVIFSIPPFALLLGRPEQKYFAHSTITASTQEDNAPGLRWPAIGLQGALRVAPYSITQTNRTTHFESNSPKRNKTRKDARHCKLAEEGFIPRTLTVKTKLSFTDRLKKGPETCKQLQD